MFKYRHFCFCFRKEIVREEGQTESDGGRQRYREREGGRAKAKGKRRDAGRQRDTEMKRER